MLLVPGNSQCLGETLRPRCFLSPILYCGNVDAYWMDALVQQNFHPFQVISRGNHSCPLGDTPQTTCWAGRTRDHKPFSCTRPIGGLPDYRDLMVLSHLIEFICSAVLLGLRGPLPGAGVPLCKPAVLYKLVSRGVFSLARRRISWVKPNILASSGWRRVASAPGGCFLPAAVLHGVSSQ
uniref:Uncharacterized protein TCIL3000_1_400 n=1 Tax=Trypanosoma congolense (strain IL3000) TaxID=1068625 RepID=G0UIT2_TRYCI|nr:unnamed protein product [Trypanosoma congolense IL3000]